uniref:Uncharacterized protein n=1 Tax=Lepeophtheirus salmonis TaxID=72036 RepID=A0A0K2U194_LEPSM
MFSFSHMILNYCQVNAKVFMWFLVATLAKQLVKNSKIKGFSLGTFQF